MLCKSLYLIFFSPEDLIIYEGVSKSSKPLQEVGVTIETVFNYFLI